MKLRVIAVVLVLCVIAGGFPLTVTSSQASSVVDQITVKSPEKLYGSGRIENPLYPDATHPAVARKASATTLSVADTTFYKSLEEAAAALRAGLVARQSEITIGYTHQGSWGTDLFDDIWNTAFAHTGVPTEGDYLQWQWGSCAYEYTCSEVDTAVWEFAVTYYPVYYTTAEQEAEVNDAVDALLDELDLWAMSDYKKICGIYDWICANVTYDYEHLEDLSYSPMFTAYAALVDGTAVCQGYANLFYRLALELGVDARIIAGIGGGSSHSWNIVKLGKAYYNADATWDASLRQAGLDYQYFLCSDSDFSDHVRDDEFLSQDFTATYQMYEISYDSKCVEHDYQIFITEPTCEKQGYTTYVCETCGTELVTDIVDALGHAFVDEVCTRCGFEIVRSGMCGDNLTWQLSEDGTLTIGGSGAMWDFDSPWAYLEDTELHPWELLSDEIIRVVFGEEVTSIGTYAFAGCRYLQAVEFGNALETIDACAFASCTALTSIAVPGSVVEIGFNAFSKCTSLKEISLSEGLKWIDEFAFNSCTALTNIVLPGTVMSIGAFAFAYCQSLSCVKFNSDPDLDSFVMDDSFSGCVALESFIVEDGHIALRSVDGVLFSGNTLMLYPEGKKDTTWTVPDGTISIGPCAFSSCKNLTDVKLNEGLESIGNSAFSSCTALTSIVIPDSVKVIGSDAFYFCENLGSVEMSEGLESIGEMAFSFCTSLENIVIPGSVKGIGWGTFYLCDNLKTIELSEGLELIDSCAFCGCYALESIVIPSSVTEIGDDAFYVCIGLKEITFTGDAPSIGQGAFASVESNVYYPADNATWTEDVMQDYGGTITWLPIEQESTEPAADFTDDGIIDNKDVEYLLWYTLFPESYPVEVDADFNDDGIVDNKDVEYLLWHTLFPDSFPL